MNVNTYNPRRIAIARMLGLSAGFLVVTAMPWVTVSYAAGPEQAKPDASFQVLDQNKDGKLTAVEVKSNVELSRRWTEVDKDDNGAIDQAEFSAFEAMQQKEHAHGSESK